MELMDFVLDETDLEVMDEYYSFRPDVPNKLKVEIKLRRHNNTTRSLWKLLKQQGCHYYGTIRGWTSVFGFEDVFLALHHFIDDMPDLRMIDGDTGLHWRDLFEPGDFADVFFSQLEKEGFTFRIPVQAFMDAYLLDFIGQENTHLQSPKHKLGIWCFREDMAILVESFFNWNMPPYGVNHPLSWPIGLEEVYEGESLEWGFIDLPTTESRPTNRGAEKFTIADQVRVEVERETDELIDYIFQTYPKIIANWSGGKDSSIIAQKCIRYKLEHPSCETELILLSADTGTADNPLMKQHLRELKKAIEAMPIEIRFIIVEPEVEDSYFTCVFGKGYKPPTARLFQWCVPRLKLDPGRKVLQGLISPGETVCQLLGVRHSESVTRGVKVDDHFGDSFFGKHAMDDNIIICAPIRNWQASDVLTYLVRNDAPWFPWYPYGNSRLLNLYGSAMNGEDIGECPIGAQLFDEDEAISSCAGRSSRFGCAFCTVIEEDHTLRNLANGDYPELMPVYHMRTLFKLTQDQRYGCYYGVQRRQGHFERGLGDLTVDHRALLLKWMNDYQIEILEEEIEAIYREVHTREIQEGLPIPMRFWDRLQALSRKGVYYSPFGLWDPILNPDGTIDRATPEDKVIIERILAQMEAGELSVE